MAVAPVAALFFVTCATACGGPTTGSDASLDGGGGDGAPLDGSPFDPDGAAQPGEGTACQFSIQCEGARQICVDGMCVREERVPADSLVAGPWQELTGPALRATRIYTAAPRDWDTVQPARPADGRFAIHPFVVPGGAAPDLAVVFRALPECTVLVVGETVRAVTSHTLNGDCVLATQDEAGRVAMVDTAHDVAVVSPDGSEVHFDHATYGPEVTAALSSPGECVGLGIPTSALLDGPRLTTSWLMMSGGAPSDCGDPSVSGPVGTGWLEFDLGADTHRLLAPDGRPMVPEEGGHLLKDARGIAALLLPTSASGPGVLRFDLATGARETVVEPLLYGLRVARPRDSEWTAFFSAFVTPPATCNPLISTSSSPTPQLAWTPGPGAGCPNLGTHTWDILARQFDPVWFGSGDVRVAESAFPSTGYQVLTIAQDGTKQLAMFPRDGTMTAGGLTSFGGFVGRYGKTREGIAAGFATSTYIDWVEQPLHRR